ncbi:MAG: four helix bundle suffix domain-containing protein [Candidatus Gottesmanbacteria bacterium]|nr:four helix bundle suffix domain-containing protein [Candidatus Gottesmanbacteria bacterium]
MNTPMGQSRPGYEYLIVYMLGKVIQDLTFQFCQRFLKSPKDPTYPNFKLVEQVNGAARSNPQNVAEGYTGESLSSYIMLVGVANGSNEELAKDLEDYLRQRNLPIWGKDHPKVREFRAFRVFWLPNSPNSQSSPSSPNSLNTPILSSDPAEAANMVLTFCRMEGYLLSQHIKSLEVKHAKEGGFRENLLKKRLDYRRK